MSEHKQTQEEHEKLIEEVKAQGIEVIEDSDTALHLDLDENTGATMEGIVRLEEVVGVEISQLYPSKTPGHHHMILKLSRKFPYESRVIIQALLGSDLQREKLNLKDYLEGGYKSNVLFKPGPARPVGVKND